MSRTKKSYKPSLMVLKCPDVRKGWIWCDEYTIGTRHFLKKQVSKRIRKLWKEQVRKWEEKYEEYQKVGSLL